jgi:hypothetical protein
MANNGIKISDIPVVTTISPTDQVIILRDPAGGKTVRNISLNNIYKATILGPFANNTDANTGGVALKSLYYDSSGNVKIRLT